ncbi:CCA tRNA nucleotidyltransferase [Patescibacteria group bacterium]|nr:CCA tRNA nucleotidyltransferase [Patescibacteria group bacterium]
MKILIKNNKDLAILKKDKFFNFIKKIKKQFPASKIYLVGGAVRDMLLKRETQDLDFVVTGIKAEDLKKFLSKNGQVNLVGQTFGVFKFIPKGYKHSDQVDIALPRKDFSFKTGAYKDVEIQSSPELSIMDDLSRRDFTINAMAIRLDKQKIEIIDLFGGAKDLKDKKIRAVKAPVERFQEDYSRMLRAIRFACQLNLQIEDKTWKAIKTKISGLNKIKRQAIVSTSQDFSVQEIKEARVVPYEVMAKEFLKSFLANSVLAFDLYDKSGSFLEIMPEILKMKNCPQPKNYHAEGDVWEHTRIALQSLTSNEFKEYFKKSTNSIELIIATLLHDIGKPPTLAMPDTTKDRIRFNNHDAIGADMANKICKRLKLSSPEKIGVNVKKITWLIKEHLILARGDISKMKVSTIVKYFFNKTMPSKDLLKLSFADISATIPVSGKPNFTDFFEMVARMEQIKKISKNKKSLPKILLNGNQIMKKFKLPAGPKIGVLLNIVREEQLNLKIKTTKQAIDFLKKYLNESPFKN